MEIVVYALLILSLLGAAVSMGHTTFDHQVVLVCRDLVLLSDVHGAEVNVPCKLEEGLLVYRDASVEVRGTSHGVVVGGQHWAGD